ncbi:hypothetical protein BGX28_007226 [Mortierella sp. GBA30]|nr:hypothetical protein BGX28_007226 [Mortierella sp. GBA30]
MEPNQAARQKRLKAGTACTNCRRKKLRCTGTPNCARCVTHNLDCVVDEALFLKTNNPQSLHAKTSSRPLQSSSSGSSHSQQHTQRSKGSNSHHYHHPYHHQDRESVYSSSGSADEMMDRGHSTDFQSDRRMSSSSLTSFSSLSPSPSPATYSYNYVSQNNNQQSSSSMHEGSSASFKQRKQSAKNTLSSSYRLESGVGPFDSPSSSRSFNTTSSSSSSQAHLPSSVGGLNKKRASKDHNTGKPKQKRRDSRDRDSDPGSPSPLLAPQDSSSSNAPSSAGGKEGEDFKSVVSTMSLDGHGQQ